MNAINRHRDLLEEFGKGASDKAQRELRPIFPDLVDHLVDDIYGFAYRREGLDIQSRHLISLAILATMGGCENQLKFQFRAALNLGLSEQAIKEVFVQVAVFAGNARAINSALVFDKVVTAQRRKKNTEESRHE